jgi:hypothetical protein
MQNVNTGHSTRRKNRGYQGPKHRRKVRAMQQIRVMPDVWQAAIKLAGGDAQRISVISPFEVIVVNHAWQRKAGAWI